MRESSSAAIRVMTVMMPRLLSLRRAWPRSVRATSKRSMIMWMQPVAVSTSVQPMTMLNRTTSQVSPLIEVIIESQGVGTSAPTMVGSP